MLLLVGEDILTTALIVLHAHDDVAENAEGRYVVVVQDDGVALCVGVSHTTAHEADE